MAKTIKDYKIYNVDLAKIEGLKLDIDDIDHSDWSSSSWFIDDIYVSSRFKSNEKVIDIPEETKIVYECLCDILKSREIVLYPSVRLLRCQTLNENIRGLFKVKTKGLDLKFVNSLLHKIQECKNLTLVGFDYTKDVNGMLNYFIDYGMKKDKTRGLFCLKAKISPNAILTIYDKEIELLTSPGVDRQKGSRLGYLLDSLRDDKHPKGTTRFEVKVIVNYGDYYNSEEVLDPYQVTSYGIDSLDKIDGKVYFDCFKKLLWVSFDRFRKLKFFFDDIEYQSIVHCTKSQTTTVYFWKDVKTKKIVCKELKNIGVVDSIKLYGINGVPIRVYYQTSGWTRKIETWYKEDGVFIMSNHNSLYGRLVNGKDFDSRRFDFGTVKVYSGGCTKTIKSVADRTRLTLVNTVEYSRTAPVTSFESFHPGDVLVIESVETVKFRGKYSVYIGIDGVVLRGNRWLEDLEGICESKGLTLLCEGKQSHPVSKQKINKFKFVK